MEKKCICMAAIKKSFVYIVGLVAFFSLVRYYGYYEDAGRYLLQVVNYLYPERFVNDVPFMYGNQDSFTLYSPVVTIFFKMLGINAGGVFLTLMVQLLWGTGLITLVLNWTKRFGCEKWNLVLFVVIVVILTGKIYGSGAYFSIIDSILVARFFAEVFILFGLAFFWNKRIYVSLILFLLGCFLHPLMAGWGILLWLLYHFPKSRLPIFVGVVLFPFTAFLHKGGFDFYPERWLSKPYCFTPVLSDTVFFILCLSFWIFVWKFVKDKMLSKFALNMFFVQLVGIFWQYAACYTGHILLFQSQTYRVQWIGLVMMVPVAGICLKEWMDGIYLPKIREWIDCRQKWFNAFFIVGLLFFVASTGIKNFVQLSVEQGVGNTRAALGFLDFLVYVVPVQKTFLVVFAGICLVQKKLKLAVIFAVSFFDECFTLLPIATMAFYLIPHLLEKWKSFLAAFVGVVSFAELLESLPNSPLTGDGVLNVVTLVVLFVCAFATLQLKAKRGRGWIALPVVLGVVTLAAWDVVKWDARVDEQALTEKQMDAFFETPVFPQVENRGKMLFVVENESPLQSRFAFLTGTYADETINVGEIFFEGQHLEAERRKRMLLAGSGGGVDLMRYGERILKVYENQDTLAHRVDYLCGIGDISHFVTDYRSMPLAKVDSAYLDVKKKFVYLYECGK